MPQPVHPTGLAVIAALLLTSAAFAGDAQQGETLAKRWCATCHQVGADPNGPRTWAPPFVTIARRPDFDATKIASFLVERHRKLHSATEPEAADIVAYIASLK